MHGLLFGSALTGYLLLVMIAFSPRVWGYQDYSEEIKRKVPPQTRRERMLAGIVGGPFFVFSLGFPVYSALMLRTRLGGEIAFFDGFIHLLTFVFFGTIGDLVFLDWLVISKITPRFVVIPGTEVEDYKDFSHHYRGHIWGTIAMVVMSGIVAAFVSNL